MVYLNYTIEQVFCQAFYIAIVLTMWAIVAVILVVLVAGLIQRVR